MKEATFWLIISLLNWSEAGNDDAVIEPAVAELSKMSEAQILGFSELLAEKLYALDTLRHAKEIGEDAYIKPEEYFSADLFLYARCVVVANGKELYEQVLIDPQVFPKDLEFEALLYIASTAYERKTGKELDYQTKISYETYANKDGWL
tara:strand:- start:49 stop:495 length:447 start_codon:yes stop_codon:yes gene_type:complete